MSESNNPSPARTASQVQRDLERLRRLGIQITRRNAHLKQTRAKEEATTPSTTSSTQQQQPQLSPLMAQWNRNGDAFMAYIRDTKPRHRTHRDDAASSSSHQSTVAMPTLVDGDMIAMSLAPSPSQLGSASHSRHHHRRQMASSSSLNLASMRVDTILDWLETHQAPQIGLAYWILKKEDGVAASSDSDDGGDDNIQFKLMPSFQPMRMVVQGKDARKSAKLVWQAARQVSQLPGAPKMSTNQFGVGLYRPKWQRIKFYWVQYVPQRYSKAYGAQQVAVKYVGKSERLYTKEDWIEALSTPFVFSTQ